MKSNTVLINLQEFHCNICYVYNLNLSSLDRQIDTESIDIRSNLEDHNWIPPQKRICLALDHIWTYWHSYKSSHSLHLCRLLQRIHTIKVCCLALKLLNLLKLFPAENTMWTLEHWNFLNCLDLPYQWSAFSSCGQEKTFGIGRIIKANQRRSIDTIGNVSPFR